MKKILLRMPVAARRPRGWLDAAIPPAKKIAVLMKQYFQAMTPGQARDRRRFLREPVYA